MMLLIVFCLKWAKEEASNAGESMEPGGPGFVFTLPLCSYSLGKLLNIAESQFPSLQNKENSIYFTVLLRGLNKINVHKMPGTINGSYYYRIFKNLLF